MEIHGTGFNNLYRHALSAVLDAGRDVAPRGQATRELLGPTLVLSDARCNLLTIPARKLNHRFSVAEFLWILLGREDVGSIAYFNKNVAQYSDDGVRFFGAYGPRLATQLPWVVRALRQDPSTRQAVATLWQPTPPATRDVPCTISFQYLLRDGRLHAHAYMRSNDAWLGLPYDLFTFTMLQAHVAAALGVPVGEYRHTVGSFHLYERDRDGVVAVLQDDSDEAIFEERESPVLTPLPEELDDAFDRLSDPATAAAYPVADAPPPWDGYLGVLQYRTTRDRSVLRPPYDAIFAPIEEVPA